MCPATWSRITGSPDVYSPDIGRAHRDADLQSTISRRCIQELIYNVNVPSRWGTQTPVTNLTFDRRCPNDLRDRVPVIGGEEMPCTRGDLGPKWT